MKRSFLQSHALFGGITDDELDEVVPLLKEEKYAKGDMIIKEGEDGDEMHFIVEGSVEVIKHIDSGDPSNFKQLAVFGPGDTFGEMELIDIQKRSASVRALEDISALTLSSKDMYKLYHSNMKAYTMIIMNVAREISRRLRRMDTAFANSLYSADDKPAGPSSPGEEDLKAEG